MNNPVSGGVFVHERGLCESSEVGDGTRIWAFAHVMRGAVVGTECNVGDHAFVEAGAVVGDRVTIKNGVAIWDRVTIGDDVFVGHNVTFINDRHPSADGARTGDWTLEKVVVGDRVSIGSSAVIMCGVTIGDGARIGAGAVVTKDVTAGATVAGVPARLIQS
jgi:UDP-2-acetamido-3-amino-2,3-dideoxy-glucuronate N-acetyltransferase